MTAATERDPHGQVTTDVIDDHILVMTVDRTEKKNAFTPKMLRELAVALTRLDDETDLFVGVVNFAGDHTTAGLDMLLFFGPDADAKLPRGLVDPLGLARRSTKPVITAVQGITYTVGIELALASDIIVAADDTRFCQLEPKRGLTALGGAPFRYVQRAGWGNAMYHLLLADEFDAAEAYRIGLVQEVVAAGSQRDRSLELARQMLACAPIATQQTIANARRLIDEGEAAAVASISDVNRKIMASEDFSEGVASFLERRDARFTGR